MSTEHHDGRADTVPADDTRQPGFNLCCPLCAAAPRTPAQPLNGRSFWSCPRCQLIFVPPSERLAPAREKACYDLHRNDPADPAYRNFLARLAGPLLACVPPGSVGLDFGCGPGPALAQMLRAAGRSTALYDPYYAPDESVWSRTYDFITATEVFEHLYRPQDELERLFAALRPGGLLALMTSLAPPPERFAAWHYHRDPTHVCFYRHATFRYVAARWAALLSFPADNVIFLRIRTGDASRTPAAQEAPHNAL
jgi:SAM-dependent methyltransferase